MHTLYGEGKLPRKYNKDGSVAEYNDKREVRKFGEKEYLLELAFELADFSWIKATKADVSNAFDAIDVHADLLDLSENGQLCFPWD